MNETSDGNNLSDECANRTASIVLQSTLPVILICHACVLTILVVSSVLTNSIVILLICKYKLLQVRNVILIASLTAADVLLNIFYSLPSLVNTISKQWLFTDHGCTAFGFLAYEFLLTRWILMGMLCLDRFFTVRFPFSYPRHSKKILLILAAVAWILPFLISSAVLFGVGEGRLREGGPTCLPTCVDDPRCQLYYAVCTSGTFFIGGILPVLLYTWMFYQGKKGRSILQMGVMSATETGGSMAVRRSFSHSLDYREKRALVTFLLLLVTVLVTGVPAYILQVVRTASVYYSCQIPIYVSFVITELLMSASTLNALVIMRDRDFRYCFKQFFFRRLSSQTKDSFTGNSVSKSASNRLSKETTENGLHLSSDSINNSNGIS